MTCNLDSSVPDWLMSYPATARVFEAYGLDTSCGGKSVRYLCVCRGLTVEAVYQSLLSAITEDSDVEQDDGVDR